LRQLRQHVEVALQGTAASSRDVRFLHRFVRRTAKLLRLKASSTQVRRSLGPLLAQMREAIRRYPGSLRQIALERMLSTYRHFAPNLFTHYDHPEIPSTDNGLEGLFGKTRRHERRITGHKSTARRTVRDGPFLVPALERSQGEQLPGAPELSRIPEEIWRRNLQALRAARARYNRPRQLRTNLKTLLQDLVKTCRRLWLTRPP